MFTMIVDYFDSIHSLLLNVNELLENSASVFSYGDSDRNDGFILIPDLNNKTLHSMYYSDENELLIRMREDYFNEQSNKDFRIWVMQWMIQKSCFSIHKSVI